MGRIIADTGKAIGTGYQLTVENAYTGMGAVAATAHSSGSTPVTEEFRVDGLGNVYWTPPVSSASGRRQRRAGHSVRGRTTRADTSLR